MSEEKSVCGTSQETVPKRIFISYSQTSPEYMDWVRELATRIQNDGFDVRLDQWYLREGDDVFAYMESMVTDEQVTKVIILCDQRYAERANARQGGIGVESTIISQELYGKVAKTKFVPVVTYRDEKGEAHLPVFLKSRYYIDFSDALSFEEKYVQLLRTIDDKPLHEPPPVGKRPRFLLEENKPLAPSTLKKRAAQSAVIEHRPTVRGQILDYLDALCEEVELLVILQEEARKTNDLEGLWWQRLEAWTPLRDEFVDFVSYLARYGQGDEIFGQLPPFFERLLPLTQDRRQPARCAHLEFAVYEAFLYTFAVLFNAERFVEAELLLSAYYRQPDDIRSAEMQRFSIFRADSEVLTNAYERKSGRKWYSPFGQLLQDRATHPQIAFEALREPDFLLYLRSELDAGDSWRLLSWPPRTWVYLYDDVIRRSRGESGLTLDFAVRARSKRFFERIMPILGVSSKDELLQKWQPTLTQHKGNLGLGIQDYHHSLEAKTVATMFEQFATEH